MTGQNPGPDPGHDLVHRLLGAYLLGGLDTADRLAVQAHLPGCATCRDEVARHADLPGLLRLAADPTDPTRATSRTAADDPGDPNDPNDPNDPGDPARPGRPIAPSSGLPDDLLGSLLDEVQLRRRNGAGGGPARVLIAASVAAVLAAVLAVGTTLAATRGRPDQNPSPAVAMSVTARPGFATTGSASLIAKPWGTSVTVDLTALPAGRTYLLKVIGPGGESQTAATWIGPANGTIHLTGATSWTPTSLTGIEVTDATGNTIAATRTRAA